MTDCIFCRIIAGEIPTELIYQDERVVAFRDIHPAAPTHILIVPRQHIRDLRAPGANEAELWTAIISAAQKLADRENLAGDGFRIVCNTGAGAGQSVFHLHLHLLGGRQLGALC